MQTTIRLLLPFTEEINGRAIDYAVQTAQQYHAILLSLALICVRPGKRARAEYMQQAQDFLTLTSTRAQRQGVVSERAQLYTGDPVRSIEAFAREMQCEAILLFLGERGTALLRYGDVQALMKHQVCNMHITLLPARRLRRGRNSALSPLLSPGESRAEQAAGQKHWRPAFLLQRLFSGNGA